MSRLIIGEINLLTVHCSAPVYGRGPGELPGAGTAGKPGGSGLLAGQYTPVDFCTLLCRLHCWYVVVEVIVLLM